VGIHGANRLGSNSLTELLVFGKMAGLEALAFSKEVGHGSASTLRAQAREVEVKALSLLQRPAKGGERVATLRKEMARTMEEGCGIYRGADLLQATCTKLAELRQRYRHLQLDDLSRGWNTEWLLALELGFQLEVAEAMAHSALGRRESRGSHQRLDGFEARDDVNFLKHTLAYYSADAPPRIEYSDVKITKSQPGVRAYGAAGEKADAERKAKETPHV
jgi:fumarate reductase flavoprotein subunit